MLKHERFSPGSVMTRQSGLSPHFPIMASVSLDEHTRTILKNS